MLEQGWEFAAKAMLLQGMGRAGGRSIYCLAFLPLPPVNPEVDFLSRLSLSCYSNGRCQKRFSGFFPLRGGEGTPPFR